MSPEKKKENEEKYARVRDRINAGEGIYAATHAEKMSRSAFYAIRNGERVEKRKYKKRGPKAKPRFMDIPVVATPQKRSGTVIVCSTDQLKSVLEAIQ